jgi:hypothetical protein
MDHRVKPGGDKLCEGGVSFSVMAELDDRGNGAAVTRLAQAPWNR